MLYPTKGNLLLVKKSLSLATVGYELMDKKRNILIREMMSLIDKARGLQSEINSTFENAYAALQIANVKTGSIQSIAGAVPVDDCITILMKSVMGVEIPTVRFTEREAQPYYGLSSSDSAMDEAYKSFMQVKKLCAALAEIENSIYRLAIAIRAARERANALKNIVIPSYKQNISYITEFLEEKEREEFIRLKVIKKRNTGML